MWDSGPMSLPCSFDYPGQLKSWLRVQGVSLKLCCFGQPFAVPGSSRRNVWVFRILLLLDETGLTAALPWSRQGMHPWVALETSTLRRMSLVQYSSCIGFPRSCRHPQTFRYNRTRCDGGTCRNKRRHLHQLLVAILTQVFLLLVFKSSSPLLTSLSSWKSWCSKWSWNDW